MLRTPIKLTNPFTTLPLFHVRRFAAAAVNCMFSAINRSPCNQATKNVMYHVARLQLPSFIDETELDLDETTTAVRT